MEAILSTTNICFLLIHMVEAVFQETSTSNRAEFWRPIVHCWGGGQAEQHCVQLFVVYSYLAPGCPH